MSSITGAVFSLFWRLRCSCALLHEDEGCFPAAFLSECGHSQGCLLRWLVFGPAIVTRRVYGRGGSFCLGKDSFGYSVLEQDKSPVPDATP